MKPHVQKKRVGVLGGSESAQYRLLFDAISQLYPVEFFQADPPDSGGLDALIVLDGNIAAGLAAAKRGLPSLVVVAGGSSAAVTGGSEVRFGTSRDLDEYLRGQQMVDEDEGACCPLRLQAGDEVLASKGGRPVWLRRPAGCGVCQLVAISPPALRESEFVFQHFNSRRFMNLLPLMNFVRQLVKDLDWQGPAPRACFVFDDPSLHFPSYGFLNYRLLAEHARKHDYFVSVATVPLDAWWVNASVAETFRSSRPRLSVLIHGNNHTTREMLAHQNGTNHLPAAAQALRRMERLERKHGISFLRVMEAPHGALAGDMFHHLLALGYEAALCTNELLVRHNPSTHWPVTFGMQRSEILGGGLPVLPRIKMSPNWKNEVLLKAFLRQPIIVAGHHGDASHGMQFLAELAKTIKGLPGVTWADIQGVLRTNYVQRIVQDVLSVKMYSRRVLVTVPSGVRHLCVERPWIESGRAEKLVVAANGAAPLVQQAGPTSERISVEKAATLEIASEVANPVHPSAVTPPTPNPWPIARKILMEVRDRLSPALPFVDRLRRPTDREYECAPLD